MLQITAFLINPSVTFSVNSHSLVANVKVVSYFCLRDTTIRINMIPIAVATRINTAVMGILDPKNRSRDLVHSNNTWIEHELIIIIIIVCYRFSLRLHLCWKQVWRWSHQNPQSCIPSFWTSPWLHTLCCCEGRRCLPACPCHCRAENDIKPKLIKKKK